MERRGKGIEHLRFDHLVIVVVDLNSVMLMMSD